MAQPSYMRNPTSWKKDHTDDEENKKDQEKIRN